MITRIEIDGFKTFKDFSVELAPFQVIVGPNGSGKSNLFDALHFLSRLTESDLSTAFQTIRGYTNELFTKLPGGDSVDRMRFAVEMLVDRRVQDDFGRSAELKYPRLRYEVEITLQTDTYGLEQLHIIHESLKSMSANEDLWCKRYGLAQPNPWIPEPINERVSFIETNLETIATGVKNSRTVEFIQPVITLYPDAGRTDSVTKYYASEVLRTVMSSKTNVEYPHIFAVNEELSLLKFLHLNPDSLRKSSPALIQLFGFLFRDGSNLPTMLARLQNEDEFAFHCVSLDMANLVPDILKIRLEKNQASNEYEIWAETADRRTISVRALSDGTLRLLALATLKNDPQFHGLLCLEEPENGVDPLHIKNMTRLLREMATDFSEPEQVDEPLRQVLITTHSPTFISQPDVLNSLLFAHTVSRVVPHKYSMEITVMVPVITPTNQMSSPAKQEVDKSEENYTIDQVQKYLDRSTFEEAQSQLERARTTLNEG